tara:strand:- start:86 stop:580 length:495 start_codon:yes stop_codon:yes gene_type:complete
MAFKMSGYTYPGKSPMKKKYGYGGLDDAIAFDKSRTKKPPTMDMTLNRNLNRAVRGVDIQTGKSFDTFAEKNLASKKPSKGNVLSRGFDTFAKKHMKTASTILKGNALSATKQIAKRVGPVGTIITGYEAVKTAVKTAPKVAKATMKGLKKRAKSGNVNIGRKL